MEQSDCRKSNPKAAELEKDIARWFAGAHKEIFGNGPQGVNVGKVDNYFVIVANKVLNKYEKSLIGISEGPYRVEYTRNLLFAEVKDELKTDFEQKFNLKVEDIRNILNVEAEKLVCIIVQG